MIRNDKIGEFVPDTVLAVVTVSVCWSIVDPFSHGRPVVRVIFQVAQAVVDTVLTTATVRTLEQRAVIGQRGNFAQSQCKLNSQTKRLMAHIRSQPAREVRDAYLLALTLSRIPSLKTPSL